MVIAETFPKERDRLRQAVASTIETFVRREATAEQLSAWAEIVEKFNARAIGAPPESVLWGLGGHRGIMGIIGTQGPEAFSAVASSVGDSMSARLTFSDRAEGHKGLAHGGMIAQAFDDLCGLFDTFVPGIRYTAELNVRFKRPIPLHLDVMFEGRVTSKQGARTTIHAQASAGGVVFAEADAVMVAKPLPG